MDMVRYNPWGMTHLQGAINKLFDNMGDAESSGVTADWIPNVDIMEHGDRFELYVDVPGVDPKAVQITLDNGVLAISGHREIPVVSEDDQPRHHRVERGHGQFFRRFILPDIVDADSVKATGRNGVLEVSIPKLAKVKPRRISVAA